MIKISDYRGFTIYIDGIWFAIYREGKRIEQMRRSYGQNPYAEVDHIRATASGVPKELHAPEKETFGKISRGKTVYGPRKKKVKRISFTTKDGRKVSFKTK